MSLHWTLTEPNPNPSYEVDASRHNVLVGAMR